MDQPLNDHPTMGGQNIGAIAQGVNESDNCAGSQRITDRGVQ